MERYNRLGYISSFSLNRRASTISFSLSLSLVRCNLSSQIRQVTFGKPGSKLTAVLILSGSSRRLVCRLLYTRYHPVVTSHTAMLVRLTGDNALCLIHSLYAPRVAFLSIDSNDRKQFFVAFMRHELQENRKEGRKAVFFYFLREIEACIRNILWQR